MSSQLKPTPVMCPGICGLGPAIQHGFFTRSGGVSEGIYSSLNVGLGSKDDPQNAVINRANICASFGVGVGQLATVRQVHSADVAVAHSAWGNERPRADGVVTKTAGLVIGILTADCGPVLFADAKAGVIGAAHAGWQGAMGGILENTILAMEELGATRGDIIATLGPSISQANYEVGPEYITKFLDVDSNNQKYFIPSSKAGHHLFDLSGYVVDRLIGADVQASALGICTYAETERFYSYRRSVHQKEDDYGRQISAIMLSA